MSKPISKLNPKKRYLQIALNNTLEEARSIIASLPISDRIIIEAGTPLIKRYGVDGIRQIKKWYGERLAGQSLSFESGEGMKDPDLGSIISLFKEIYKASGNGKKLKQIIDKALPAPYIVADLKAMDRGQTEVEIAALGGASAAVALGTAPIETLDSFIEQCERSGLDAMIDMMNVEFPLSVLRSLKKIPPVVIIHRGVDEERLNHEKQIPLHEIRRIKGNFNIMISIAGGDTLREVQRSVFNDADIVVVWKSVYQNTNETISLINGFLKEIK